MKHRSTTLALAATLAAALSGFTISAYADGMDKGMDSSMNAMPAQSDSMKTGNSGMTKTDCKPKTGTNISDQTGQSDKMAKGCDDTMKQDDKTMSDMPMKKPQ